MMSGSILSPALSNRQHIGSARQARRQGTAVLEIPAIVAASVEEAQVGITVDEWGKPVAAGALAVSRLGVPMSVA
jgi:hypothetical protein